MKSLLFKLLNVDSTLTVFNIKFPLIFLFVINTTHKYTQFKNNKSNNWKHFNNFFYLTFFVEFLISKIDFFLFHCSLPSHINSCFLFVNIWIYNSNSIIDTFKNIITQIWLFFNIIFCGYLFYTHLSTELHW